MALLHAQRQQMPNSSSITQFLLLAFADMWALQPLHFCLFLGIYLAALLGNSLIITAIACNDRLHTPMYFFHLNLALLDLGSKPLHAICKPLHYGTLLGSSACAKMAAAAWGSSFLSAVLHAASTCLLPLCQGNAVDQFCEILQILKVFCSDSYLREVGLLVVSVFLVFGCFDFIMLSYLQVFRAALRIPSEQGQHKAFSTCLPYLAMVSFLISTAMFTCLKPPSISFPSLDLVVAVLYAVVPPAVNPLIHSMRNKELKHAIRKIISWMFLSHYELPSTLYK
ncbi:olfactory receptor 14C36 [Phalacrocorax carbo]|uniref:olfactory receptor 14C36 n=1 Tax=Phalacrocorax carbo TaxID=9209 RepID=UPI00311A23AE